MHKIKLVLADMDGTLLPFGAERVPSRALEAIRALDAVGIRFGLATGRDRRQLLGFFDGDDFAFKTGILANGMKVYVDGRLDYLMLLENESLQLIADVLAETPGAFLNVYPDGRDDEEQQIISIGCSREELEAFTSVVELPGDTAPCVPDIPISSATIACLGDDDELSRVRNRLKHVAPCFDYISPFRNWCDILPAGVNKGTGLPTLMRSLGIGPDEVLYFGDAENDLPIMGALDNTVAMANSMPAAAAAARWHIGPCDEDGLAIALEELARATKAGETPSFMS